ncbi:hypothetical protein QBC46DRAFT_392564 [Diplogelasinospora grovesii]|uniref:Uncharacterized protein n=1 Tax=Diplogelasinospora grovesii TaxID=303347 RepID=A0AAN6N2R7_9PEZI|nr:hypothetical protein QBC46DRAFT_392564 [Diplogelasinospora grovesii]
MRVPILSSIVLAACLPNGALAVTPVSDGDMTSLLNAGGVDLAIAASPMWFFGQALDHPPCYPTNATDASGGQTPSASLCDWPNTGCHCRNPGVGIGNPGPAFPVYYSYQKCNSTQVRVAYNLFYEKDGFNPDKIFGHPFDWERCIVIWSQQDDTTWTPSQLMLSQHSGYQTLNWANIQNTFNTADVSLPRGGDNGRQNLDHAKVYVAWSKHAHYDTRNTGWNDPISQLTDNAFRSQDWWYFPTKGDYLRADGSTALGALIRGYDWADATSNPASVNDGLCSAS